MGDTQIPFSALFIKSGLARGRTYSQWVTNFIRMLPGYFDGLVKWFCFNKCYAK